MIPSTIYVKEHCSNLWNSHNVKKLLNSRSTHNSYYSKYAKFVILLEIILGHYSGRRHEERGNKL